MHLDVFKHRMSVAAAAQSYIHRMLNFRGSGSEHGQADLQQGHAGICVPANLPSKLTCPKGKWLLQALDVLMVTRAIEEAFNQWSRQQQQAELCSNAPR
jgi:hypothetical protein